MRGALLAAVTCLLGPAIACVSSAIPGPATQARLAAELVSRGVSSEARRGFADEILVDATTVARMHAEASRNGMRLIGVAHVRTGFHPWHVVAFLGAGRAIRAVDTGIYWGEVREKCDSIVTPDLFDLLLEEARETLRCGNEAPLNPSLDTWLVVHPGESDEQVCTADWATKASGEFNDRLVATVQNAIGGWICHGLRARDRREPNDR